MTLMSNTCQKRIQKRDTPKHNSINHINTNYAHSIKQLLDNNNHTYTKQKFHCTVILLINKLLTIGVAKIQLMT